MRAADRSLGVVKSPNPLNVTQLPAVGNPNAYVRVEAGDLQFSVTARSVHAAQIAFPPSAVERGDNRPSAAWRYRLGSLHRPSERRPERRALRNLLHEKSRFAAAS